MTMYLSCAITQRFLARTSHKLGVVGVRPVQFMCPLLSSPGRHVQFMCPLLSSPGRHYNTPPPDRRTTALTIISDLRHLRHSPAPALALGLSGLVPFVAAPGIMIVTQAYCADLAFAQMAYGAAILSFLGGVRWGLTLPSASDTAPTWRNLGYSTTPALVAWAGLLMPYPAAVLTVMAGLAGAAYADMTMTGYPAWFKAMRFLLTFVAVLSLWTTLTCKYLISNKPKSLMDSNSIAGGVEKSD